MSVLFAVSVGLALLVGGATAAAVATWPRRLSAEEWVLHRRAAAAVPKTRPRLGSTWQLPMVPQRWLQQRAYQEAAKAIEAKLASLAARGAVTLPTRRPLKRIRRVEVSGRPVSETVIEDRR